MTSRSRLTLATVALLVVLPASAAPRRVRLDPERSHLAARTRTAGLLGFLGHAHGVLATSWNARICVDPAAPAGGAATVTVAVASLRIDTAPAFEHAGLERAVDEEEQRELQEKMTGPEVLDAAAHPEIVFRSTALRLDREGRAELEGELTLHGKTNKVAMPIVLSGLERGTLSAKGELEIRQSDFGIEPESVAGVVKVADRVTLLFDLSGTLTDEACD